MTGPKPDWSDPRTIPLGYRLGLVPESGEGPDPAYVQANLFTLSQIGGIYDLLALEVERQHLVILTAWRLDSGAPRVIDYLRNRPHAVTTPNN